MIQISLRQTPAMIVASLFSITAGGSAGPSPHIQINGSLAASWVKLKLTLILAV